MDKEEIKKMLNEFNTQQLFDYAYNLGWKDAIKEVVKNKDNNN
jgi:uncharacterized protein (DUF2164 family)